VARPHNQRGKTMKKLTPKQERFCLKYIETGNASEAYRQAYDATNMSQDAVKVKASAMLKKDNIRVTLENLKKPAIEAAQMTLKQHLDDLRELRDLARNKEQYGPAITAEVARGKASGVHIEKTENTNLNTVINFNESKD
jgi:phage terminase small subunit